jgi:hypothetical protein
MCVCGCVCVCVCVPRSRALSAHLHHCRSLGINYGCIFDGVTAGGKINAFAAQSFTDSVLSWLGDNPTAFRRAQTERNTELARQVMLAATESRLNPGLTEPAYQADGGSATGAFVTFQKISKTAAHLHGGSIGDVAVLVVHLRQELARQLNPVFRKHDKDTGGQLTMSIGLDGPVWPLSCEVTSDEIVVLSTDGLTDNLNMPELDRVLPLILRAQLFDSIVPFDCEPICKSPPMKPTYTFLRDLTRNHLDPLAAVPCRAACVRLFNYVEWVTRSYFKQEEVFYDLSLRVAALERAVASGAKSAPSSSGLPPSGASAALSERGAAAGGDHARLPPRSASVAGAIPSPSQAGALPDERPSLVTLLTTNRGQSFSGATFSPAADQSAAGSRASGGSRPSSVVGGSPAITRTAPLAPPPRSLEEELADLQDQMSAMAEARRIAGKAAKTDDAMILVLRPFCEC